jgi:hypothetical protein
LLVIGPVAVRQYMALQESNSTVVAIDGEKPVVAATGYAELMLAG